MAYRSSRLLAVAAAMLLLPGCPRSGGGIGFGRKPAGGVRITLQASPKPGDYWPAKPGDRLKLMRSARETILNRVKGMAEVVEPTVQIKGDDKLVVELPGLRNAAAATRPLTSTGRLEFYYLANVRNTNNPLGKWRLEAGPGKGESYLFTGPRGETIDSAKQPAEVLEKVVEVKKNKPILTGRDLLPNAKASISPRNQIVINTEFNRTGTEIFRTFTRSHVGDCLAVFFDGKLLTAPTINEPIPSGKAQISGFRGLSEARRATEYLNAGALPVPLKVIAVKKL